MRWRALARLTPLLACVALATSRFGLIAHELAGHGGVALALGGRLTAVQLFWFAGGWISYDLTGAGAGGVLAVDMGGFAIELLLGALLWWRVRGDTLGARLVRGVGGALIVHAGWYASTGIWHGYGDGARMAVALGAARAPVAAAIGVATCAMARFAARWVLGAIAASVPGPRGARLASVGLALVLAAGLNGALDVGEMHVRRDARYSQIMAPERDRVVSRELAAWARAREAAGVDPSAAERATEQAALDQANREFPFRWVLLAGLFASALAGAWRSRPPAREVRITRGLLVRAAIASVGSVALVIVLDVVLSAALGM